ncbi:formate/nitrite transporter family protein [Staphylococcus pseudintermedius]|uniref:formate/nitrite transporter family protein n=1 Tax=Staphylococcus pseudintermedius TaxID=283734 RepID=UPI000C1BB5A1|nr:formate/nitrite transporter family protein [Staphylococcus pseudintermedius]EGQ0289021.1 formate/nitrite transporter family protein [Staphylococcus pseudintermedius]EGQ0310056.1 formate/nitrite transporter family protein [Staphylococcus pseudintermedius]EGQ0327164.1 formate/nitrite transporter family protein [Staphylococcus pseudintermedius]EGQ0360472.1 formate/nitrite transporter family protein [Staphylococcus pseudintermedius]EGQ0362702.1 formate/nitrite transporter family protein [Staphy
MGIQKPTKTVSDTYTSRETVQSIIHSVAMKEVMLDKAMPRYILKSMLSGFLLTIVTVFMLAMKTQLAGALPGVVNLMGAAAFSIALVFIVLTQAELLTSNFMYMTVGLYYRTVSFGKTMWLFTICFIGNILGAFVLFILMYFTKVMTPEMIAALTSTVDAKTVESTWQAILVKAIFANFFINIGIYVSMQYKEGLSKTFFIAIGVIIFVFMGYEHVVYNAGLFVGMIFYNFDATSWLGVLKNIVFAFIGNYIGGGIFVGLLFAYFNGSRRIEQK